jgi:hypothetical protein
MVRLNLKISCRMKNEKFNLSPMGGDALSDKAVLVRTWGKKI